MNSRCMILLYEHFYYSYRNISSLLLMDISRQIKVELMIKFDQSDIMYVKIKVIFLVL